MGKKYTQLQLGFTKEPKTPHLQLLLPINSGLGTPGADHVPPAGSWVGVARAVASSLKASARPCSCSTTSRRCGSRCECAQCGAHAHLSTWPIACLVGHRLHPRPPCGALGGLSVPGTGSQRQEVSPGPLPVSEFSSERGAGSECASCLPCGWVTSSNSGSSLGLSVLSWEMGPHSGLPGGWRTWSLLLVARVFTRGPCGHPLLTFPCPW